MDKRKIPIDTVQIETFVADTIGLDISMTGREYFAGIVGEHMESLGIRSTEEYLAGLRNDSRLKDDLVERIVVHETWFFRGKYSFEYVRKYLRECWFSRHHSEKLRVLSSPCSTGEEAYSLAMVLLAEGIGPDRVQIDAVDISRKAIESAERGLYRQSSFRDSTSSAPERYFQHENGTWQIDSKVREMVNFIHGNLIEPGFLAGKAPYHIVFCRNVLFYFTVDGRKAALNNLERLSVEGGLLVTGHAEANILMNCRFRPVSYSQSFAFIHELTAGAEIKPELPPAAIAPGKKPFAVSGLARNNVIADIPVLPAEREPEPVLSAGEIFERARALADSGKYEEASELCDSYFERCWNDPEAYLLKGIVEHALNRHESAEKNFNQALYLDPNNYDSLMHQYILCEETGQHEKSARFLERARRVYGRFGMTGER